MERNQGQHPGSKRDSSAELLGRYALLAEIAEGELTTVQLARQHGESGFQRLVALKRLKPLFARQPECVQLLLDEARLTAGLHHANVIGCLDMGTEDGCYVVQNYVEGDSLEGLLKCAGRERHPRFIVPLIVDVLNGLHAVHTALDDEGVPLGLVHQAPRARHVLVGIDGIARLTDFTQAKARGLTPSRQRSDRLKIEHMAPEQALNPEAVDHRADLFLVGVMLWEALTGERLFAAETEELTFQHLLHRRILRPSEVGQRPPRCFDAICLRALERDPDKRYRSSLEMARELRDAALNHALYATTGEIGQWVKALAGPKLIERRKLAGSESSSQDLPVEALPSSSGFFQATKPTDVYGSGLIFGGSFSRLDPGAPVDPDKTPAIGTRALSGYTPPRERDDEPTARHRTALQQRERKSTEPYWPVPPGTSDAAPQTAVTPDVAPLPHDDSEVTRARSFAPSRPGSARADSVPSPGAYSQVASARKSRPSAPQAGAAPGAPASGAALPGTARVPGAAMAAGARTARAPMAPLGADAAQRPSQPAAPAGARPLAPARPKAKAAVDAPSTLDHRSDSTPARLLVPTGPVGSPYRAASPSKTPKAFELPPIPRALGELTGRTRTADVLQMPVDSLSPPNSAANSTAPAPDEAVASQGGRAIWVVTGVLAAIILLAVGVSVRKMQTGAEPQRVAASQPVRLEPPQPVVAKPALEVTPKAKTPAAAPEAPSAVAPPSATPHVLAGPVGAKPVGAKPVGARPAGVQPLPAPQTPAPLTGPKPRPRNKLPIPDNPY